MNGIVCTPSTKEFSIAPILNTTPGSFIQQKHQFRLLITGLTCRVGRAVFGATTLIRDLLESEQSILVLGRPGIGKTTIIREIARVLSDEMGKRVVVVDTSNEIAGDSNIPHSGIGRARRMQVSKTELQYQVMLEAVENHMPEAIVIDEISTELEALATCTIAEKGIQLIGTIHGNCLKNLIKNPCLFNLTNCQMNRLHY